jgi:rhodanese-related sulfurtransferase
MRDRREGSTCVRRPIALVVVIAALLMSACSSGGDSTASGTPSGTASHQLLTAEALHGMLASDDVYLVNVHVPYEGEIPGTDAFIPYDQIASRLDELPFDSQQVVIYCRSGNMSSQSAAEMVAAGAPPFFELSGGYYAWENAGYPLEVNN